MKHCPRCKSQLIKSHSQKLICKACGYMTRKLEVVRENQQFNQHVSYTKKIISQKTYEQSKRNDAEPQIKNHFIVVFQLTLQQALSKVTKHSKNSTIESYCRFIWFTYANFVYKNDIDFCGIFRKHIANNNNKKAITGEENSVKEFDDEHPEEQQKMEEIKQQKDQSFEKQNKNRRGRPKKKQLITESLSTHIDQKSTFVSQIRSKIVSINQQEDYEVRQQRQQFLKYIYSTAQYEQISSEDINYAATKYAELLIKDARQFNLHLDLAEAKGRQSKITVKELQSLVKTRNLQFKQKKQMILVLLLEDLLRLWGLQVKIPRQSSFSYLLIQYSSTKNKKGRKIIGNLINQLKQCISISEDPIQSKQMKVDFPELSFNLIYAILYISCLVSGEVLTINEIAQICGRLQMKYNEKDFIFQQKLNSLSIRKTAAKLMRVLNLNYILRKEGVKKWVRKYAKICGLSQIGEIEKLSEILFKSYQLSKVTINQQVRVDKRFEFLEQDIIGRAMIVIYLKLQFGFQNDPLLYIFPEQLLDYKGIPGKYKEILEAIQEKRSKIDVKQVIFNLGSYFEQNPKKREIKRLFSFQSYHFFDNQTTSQLKQFNELFLQKMLKLPLNLTQKSKIEDKIRPFHLETQHNKANQDVDLTQKFKEQLDLAIYEKQQSYFNPEQFDLPSSNYEFFFQYLSNLKYAGKELFLFFIQKLAGGQCKLSHLFEWIEKMQRVLIQFED